MTGTHEFLTSAEAATKARDALGILFIDVARKSKIGLRDLSAVSGLHRSTVRAMIQRAIGPGLPDGFEQPELPVYVDLAVGHAVHAETTTADHLQIVSPSRAATNHSPAVNL